ncbi:DNA-binding protein [Acidithiobacillus sp. VAN18-1]|uniref:DNA-binding protein n=1 Tax=Igneacidithiobacillus copahuensis TaxID=2724909 RepID=A0AAE3CJ36_9PROT|nr:hypothetical protein [Igneacidithiobacillus copahuensis]MBU2787324.1 DNA-binding protein [Igneacidithiobacillus copahuensis]MBU2797343.1 DNA-binding protein [Acidithiobacillus sp. VAN18-2]
MALQTVKQFIETHPYMSAGGMRHLLFFKMQELQSAGIVSRIGRKILIDSEAFEAWVKGGNAQTVRGDA